MELNINSNFSSEFESNLICSKQKIKNIIDTLKVSQNQIDDFPGGDGNLVSSREIIQDKINYANKKIIAQDMLMQDSRHFYDHAVDTDKAVGDFMNQNLDTFYSQNSWAKPKESGILEWWKERMKDIQSFFKSIGEFLESVLNDVIDFIKEHAMEIIVGIIGLTIAAIFIALSAETLLAFLAVFLKMLVSVGISMLVDATIEAAIAGFTGEDIGEAFGDGLASGFMFGGIMSGFTYAFRFFKYGKTATKVIDKADDIIRDGSHMDDAGKLKPNVKYQAGEYEYIYTTNDSGLVEHVHADKLYLKKHKGRLKHNQNSLDKLEGDHAGHLIGDLFGGSPELDNIVSQASHVNQSDFLRIEKRWKKVLDEGGSITNVNIHVEYPPGSKRPSKFIIKYIENGKTINRPILNI